MLVQLEKPIPKARVEQLMQIVQTVHQKLVTKQQQFNTNQNQNKQNIQQKFEQLDHKEQLQQNIGIQPNLSAKIADDNSQFVKQSILETKQLLETNIPQQQSEQSKILLLAALFTISHPQETKFALQNNIQDVYTQLKFKGSFNEFTQILEEVKQTLSQLDNRPQPQNVQKSVHFESPLNNYNPFPQVQVSQKVSQPVKDSQIEPVLQSDIISLDSSNRLSLTLPVETEEVQIISPQKKLELLKKHQEERLKKLHENKEKRNQQKQASVIENVHPQSAQQQLRKPDAHKNLLLSQNASLITEQNPQQHKSNNTIDLNASDSINIDLNKNQVTSLSNFFTKQNQKQIKQKQTSEKNVQKYNELYQMMNEPSIDTELEKQLIRPSKIPKAEDISDF
ncbi:Hypothetical_protein [Hexamita inflata]|uniref:Hypothetical_protein n=1 Tax=Hexamita inflata TaxID=28002 RepID=A0AA86NSE4_9EUKA|nr:Hypothetical protein HINF_LOCUS12439 [Hexamita inflata]